MIIFQLVHVVYYTYKKKKVYVVFVLIAVMRNLTVVVFWFLTLSIIFCKI